MGNPLSHGTDQDRNIIVQVNYDKAGRMTGLRDPNGHLRQYEYDQLDRRKKFTNALGTAWDTAYEDVPYAGTRTTMTYPNDGVTPYDVQRDTDSLGRLLKIAYGDQASTPDVAFTYALNGQRAAMIETGTSGTVRETQYGYDNARRLEAVDFDNDGDGSTDETVSYTYDVAGARTKMTMPGGLEIAYQYDARGRLSGMSDWDSHQTSYVYDDAGRHAGTVQVDGLRTEYRYDAGSRLRRIHTLADSKTRLDINYQVDARGNRTQAQERLAQSSSITATYGRGNVSYPQGQWTDDGIDFKKTTDFSAELQLSNINGDELVLNIGTGPNHSIFDVYIDGSLWQSIDGYAAAAGERQLFIGFDDVGPHTLELRNRAQHSLKAQQDGAYDPNSFILRFKQVQVMSTTYSDHTVDYEYDTISRLLEAVYSGGSTDSYDYAYDLAGNRASKTVNGTTTTNFGYNAANQLISRDATTLTYDKNGNLTDDGWSAYEWDRANRMIVDKASFPVIKPTNTFRYDGLGNRIQAVIGDLAGGTVIEYLLDLQPGLPQVVRTGRYTTPYFGDPEYTYEHYVHGPRGIHTQQNADDTWNTMLSDGLHSVRGLVDESGVLIEAADYDPYGVPDAPLTGTDFAFTGEMRDANGLQYHRARYYAPSLGVFPSLDPFEGTMGRPMSLNGYSWVSGNPINRVDPNGMFDWRTFTVEQGDTLSCIAAEAEIPANEFVAFFYAVQAINNSLYAGESILSNPPTSNRFCSAIGGLSQTTYNPVQVMVDVPPETAMNGTCMATTVFVSPQPIVYHDRICYNKQILIPDTFGSRSGIVTTGRRNENKFCCGGLSGNVCGQQAPYTNPTDTKMLVTGFYAGGEITLNDFVDLDPNVSYDNLGIAFEWYTETLGGRQGWVASTSFNIDPFNLGGATGNAGGKIGAWDQWPNQGDYLVSESYNFGLGPAAVSFSPDNVGQNPISALLQGDFVMQFGWSGGITDIVLPTPTVGRGATVSLYLGDGSFDKSVLLDLLEQSDNREKLSFMLQFMNSQQIP